MTGSENVSGTNVFPESAASTRNRNIFAFRRFLNVRDAMLAPGVRGWPTYSRIRARVLGGSFNSPIARTPASSTRLPSARRILRSAVCTLPAPNAFTSTTSWLYASRSLAALADQQRIHRASDSRDKRYIFRYIAAHLSDDRYRRRRGDRIERTLPRPSVIQTRKLPFRVRQSAARRPPAPESAASPAAPARESSAIPPAKAAASSAASSALRTRDPARMPLRYST